MPSLAELTASIRQRAAQNPPLGYKVKIDLGAEGVIHWDGHPTPAVIGNDPGEADTTLTISPDNLQKMIDGDLDATFAYMTGKLKVGGSMGVALKLAGYLAD